MVYCEFGKKRKHFVFVFELYVLCITWCTSEVLLQNKTDLQRQKGFCSVNFSRLYGCVDCKFLFNSPPRVITIWFVSVYIFSYGFRPKSHKIINHNFKVVLLNACSLSHTVIFFWFFLQQIYCNPHSLLCLYVFLYDQECKDHSMIHCLWLLMGPHKLLNKVSVYSFTIKLLNLTCVHLEKTAL